jgi:hypothetical protein
VEECTPLLSGYHEFAGGQLGLLVQTPGLVPAAYRPWDFNDNSTKWTDLLPPIRNLMVGQRNRLISVHRLGEIPIQSCGQSVSAPRGKLGARLNAHTELRAKRQRSARQAIYRNWPLEPGLTALSLRACGRGRRFRVYIEVSGFRPVSPSSPGGVSLQR